MEPDQQKEDEVEQSSIQELRASASETCAQHTYHTWKRGGWGGSNRSDLI